MRLILLLIIIEVWKKLFFGQLCLQYGKTVRANTRSSATSPFPVKHVFASTNTFFRCANTDLCPTCLRDTIVWRYVRTLLYQSGASKTPVHCHFDVNNYFANLSTSNQLRANNCGPVSAIAPDRKRREYTIKWLGTKKEHIAGEFFVFNNRNLEFIPNENVFSFSPKYLLVQGINAWWHKSYSTEFVNMTKK